MYLHIGDDCMITAEDIIGVFDIEATTVSQDTRNFLNSAAKRKCDVSCTEEMPRSFVVTFDKEYLDEKVYISRINPKTIEKRIHK